MPQSWATSLRLACLAFTPAVFFGVSAPFWRKAGRSSLLSKGNLMKIAALIARYLLGLVFLVFGLNGFIHFIPMQPLPPGPAGQFLGALFASHYVPVVSAFQVAGGLLLLVNRYVPLAMVLLGPVIVNIFLFHLLMDTRGLPLAIVVVILWGILFFRHRQHFAGIFVQRTS
jgi:putative oxidoreductase